MSLATTTRIPAGSTEYVGMIATGPAGLDLTDDAVQLAVINSEVESPEAPVWHDPSLMTFPSPNAVHAQLLIGPLGVELDRGRYRLWMKVSDTPEVVWVASPTLFQIY